MSMAYLFLEWGEIDLNILYGKASLDEWDRTLRIGFFCLEDLRDWI